MRDLSIIIPWCDRNELPQSLSHICLLADELKASITIVNYSGDKNNLFRMISPFQNINVIDVLEDKWFNKSRANNIGAASTESKLIFFCDCDIIIEISQFYSLFTAISSQEGLFGTLAGVRETQLNARQAGNVVRFGYTLQLRIACGRSLTIVDHEEDAESGARQAPGLLLVRRSDFLSVQGYNGAFEGWGWEDQDMIARLTLGAGLARHQSGLAQHISHDDESRTARYACGATNRWESRDRIFRKALENYDNNNFMGTYVDDEATYRSLQGLMA